MNIQFNTDKTISGDDKQQLFFKTLISEKLHRFETHITRIEVHLSDENGNKEGINDINCLLEARLEGRQPTAVSYKADTVVASISGAIEKLKSSLDTVLGRLQEHRK